MKLKDSHRKLGACVCDWRSRRLCHRSSEHFHLMSSLSLSIAYQ
jgi:hypothetical protein